MPGRHSAKQKRQASHIAKSERARGKSTKTAQRIAWATVNKLKGRKKKRSRKGKK